MLGTFVVVAAAGLGACIGSFLNVVIYRVPAGRSLGGRSHCPHCNARIPFWRNIPVFGWLLLRGRAACCGKPIAVRYALVELLTAVLFALLAWAPPALGPIVHGEQFDGTALAAFACHAVFMSLLIACSFIDLDHRILPDLLTKPGMGLGVAACYLVPGLAGFDVVSENNNWSPQLSSLLTSLLGLGVGFGTIWLIRVVAGRIFRREAMGFGDVKFLGMIGAFLGWQGALLTLFLACVIGAVIGLLMRIVTKDSMIPFGPFLALGAVATLFGKRDILVLLFEKWPEWQRGSAAAPWILLAAALLSLLALFFLVRRGRGK